MTSRHKRILAALLSMDKLTGTTRQLAVKVNLHVNGVSQSLTSLQKHGYVKYLDGKAGEMTWQLLTKAVDQLQRRKTN